MKIREAVKEDFEQIWIIFQHIVSAGEIYSYPVETSKEEAFQIWMEQPLNQPLLKLAMHPLLTK